VCLTQSIISTIKSRKMRWAGHVVRTAFRSEKMKGRAQVRRSRRRWKDKMKTDPKKI
jgi:hypothetical protein